MWGVGVSAGWGGGNVRHASPGNASFSTVSRVRSGEKLLRWPKIGSNRGLDANLGRSRTVSGGRVTTGTGIPGLRGGDHVGITVPDMAQAHEFLVDVLGCQHVYSLPGMRHDDDDWMLEHLNVDPRRVVREIRFYRCGHGLNLEVFAYASHEGQR